MPERLRSKSFKLCFNSSWAKDFQMYKVDLEKADEPEIKRVRHNLVTKQQ